MGTGQDSNDPMSWGLAPRGLSRIEAARYIGVGPTLFDRLVADGLMPNPIRIYARRVVWDRLALDAAFAALPTGGEEDRADVWDRCAA